MTAPLPPPLPVRFSVLKAFGRSAAHGKHAREVEMEPTYSMQRGTAVHALVFGTRKVCSYPSVRRGKAWEAFVADTEHADTEILTLAEYDKACRMADSVRGDALAMSVLSGECEKTIRFTWNGLTMRATPDCRGGNFLTELKTSTTVDPVRFPWHAIRMAYHAQMALQCIACGNRIDDCYIVAVEAAEPFPVQVYRLDERALDVGYKLLMSWSERLKQSEESQSWPAYSTTILPIDIIDDETELVFPEDEEA